MYTTDQTWINVTTVIYIDQPVQTGFSYGTPLLTDMDEVKAEFVYFLGQIWDKFPVLKTKDLYMTGESYAGHYIPAFSWELFQNNNSFRLKASLIGDPYTAALT